MSVLRVLVLCALLLPACRNKGDTADTGGLCTWYVDADGDGWGAGEQILGLCDDQPAASSDVAGDCDDGNGAVSPDRSETAYDGLDNDCDPATPDDDLDADGHGAATDCDDADAEVNPDAIEVCNGVDDDCDLLVDDDDPGVLDAQTWYADTDSDGYGDEAATVKACEAPPLYGPEAGDCDDSDATVNPGATEVCNEADDDCDGLVDAEDDSVEGRDTYYLDADGDGHGSSSYSVEACSAPEGFAESADDCDDGEALTWPGANESCDGEDNDCDGDIDEEADDSSTWYADVDGDGYGDPDSSTVSCEGSSALVADATDCDDGDAAVHPGAVEVCDGDDEDCDALVDDDDPDVADQGTWYADVDGDGFGDASAPTTTCWQPSSTVADDTDCDDGDASAWPGAPEVCDGDDEDCDTLVDDDDPDLTDATTWYLDVDGDGFGQSAFTVEACEAPSGYVSNDLDCDDAHGEANPVGTEVCDGLDNDCDGDVDDGASDFDTFYSDTDGDGYGDPDSTVEACSAPTGTVADGTDCDDDETAVNPGAEEVCDGEDNDCDGDVDGGATDAGTWYADSDGDGYGDSGAATTGCEQPTSTVENAEDCDDSDAAVNPDTTWYLDYDGDGYGDSALSATGCEAPSGLYVLDDGDCDDTDSSFNPGASPACDGTDRDCDGLTDNDADGDGYADHTCGGDDCDDTDAAVLPEPSGGCAVGVDCLDVLGKGYTTDGAYAIDPDGYGTGVDPEDVWCDMGTSGGGWTLVATQDWSGTWSTTNITDTSVFGSLSTTSDYKAEAFSSVPFEDLLFVDGDGMFAAYEGVSDGSGDFQAFQDAVPANCGEGTDYEWAMTDGDFTSSTLCSTNLYLHVLDHDGYGCEAQGHSINHGTGPGWSAVYNEGCPLDDPEGSSFINHAYGAPWSTSVPLSMYVR